MTDENTTVPADADNTATEQPVENQAAGAPMPMDNADNITPEKREELARKLTSSKEEALRLKAEIQIRDQKIKEMEEAYMNQRQQSTNDSVQVNESEIEYLRELGKKAGFVSASELEAIKQQSYKEKQQVAFEVFMAKHPELNKPGDPQSDKLWGAFQSELKQFQPPENPKDYGTQFEKAYRIITWDERQVLERGKSLGYAQANMANNSQLGSGSLGGSSAPTAQKSSPERQAISQGFAAIRPQYYKHLKKD